MNISILIATYGDSYWQELALSRAYESAKNQGAYQILLHHQCGSEFTVASTRNAAAEIATGDWLLFLDGDDELGPGYLAAMRRALEQERGVHGGTPLLLTPAVAYTYTRRPSYKGKIWPETDIRDGNWLCIGTLLQRDLFLIVGGFRDWPIFEDWCLWQRCVMQGAAVIRVPDAHYVAHRRKYSRNRSAQLSEREYWHQRIGHANWPDYYDATTVEEDKLRALIPFGVRKK